MIYHVITNFMTTLRHGQGDLRDLQHSILNKALSVKHKLASREHCPEGIHEGDTDGGWLVELKTSRGEFDGDIGSLKIG